MEPSNSDNTHPCGIQSSIDEAEDSFEKSMPIENLIETAEQLNNEFILREIMLE